MDRCNPWFISSTAWLPLIKNGRYADIVSIQLQSFGFIAYKLAVSISLRSGHPEQDILRKQIP